MPGLFGAIGSDPRAVGILTKKWDETWARVETTEVGGGFLGAHVHPSTGASALLATSDGWRLALDGEVSVYRAMGADTAIRSCRMFGLGVDGFRLTAGCRGNVAAVDSESGQCYLAAEWTGHFPLYYTRLAGGLLFGSLLRPIVSAVNSVSPVRQDAAGALEFIRNGYTLMGRTPYQGIHRLLPGQVLTYIPPLDHVVLRETSDLWAARYPWNGVPFDELVDICWRALGRAVERSVDTHKRVALMYSAGWDSRILLAALRKNREPAGILCYYHGALDSRERRIAEGSSRAIGVEFRAEPLPDADTTLALAEETFPKTESVGEVQWYRAGQLLREMGVEQAACGLLGEILGGRFSRLDLENGLRRATAAAEMFTAHWVGKADSALPDALAASLRSRLRQKPWFLTAEAWESFAAVLEEVDADIDAALQRYAARGVTDPNRLFEAFEVEHLSFSLGAQARQLRAVVDLAIPYAEGDLLELSTAIPLEDKFTRKLCIPLLRRNAPELASYSTAATLTSVGSPHLVQEASRLGRYLLEKGHWHLHHWFRSVPHPRSSWTDWEYLQHSDYFERAIGRLETDLWDRDELNRRLQEIRNHDQRQIRFPTAIFRSDINRITATDFLLRSS